MWILCILLWYPSGIPLPSIYNIDGWCYHLMWKLTHPKNLYYLINRHYHYTCSLTFDKISFFDLSHCQIMTVKMNFNTLCTRLIISAQLWNSIRRILFHRQLNIQFGILINSWPTCLLFGFSSLSFDMDIYKCLMLNKRHTSFFSLNDCLHRSTYSKKYNKTLWK